MNNECKALIPYEEPKKQKKGYFTNLFLLRKNIYILFLIIFIISAISGSANYKYIFDDVNKTEITKNILNNINQTYTDFLSIINTNINIIITFFTLFLFAQTIFSPVVSILFTAFISYRIGIIIWIIYQAFATNKFILILFLLIISFMVFISILYAAEVFIHFEVASKSIRYILKTKNLLPIFLKTLACMIIYILSLDLMILIKTKF